VRQLDGGAERAGARFRPLFRARARTVPPLAATAAAQTPGPDRPPCQVNRQVRRYAVGFRIPQAAPERRSSEGGRSEKFSRARLFLLFSFSLSLSLPAMTDHDDGAGVLAFELQLLLAKTMATTT
jgi:hypothetical protein